MRPLEDLDAVSLTQLHDRLLPTRLRAALHPAAFRLCLHLGDVHALDLDVEQLFDRLTDLRLVRVWMDVERVLAYLHPDVCLLRHDRCEENFVGVQAHDVSPFAFGLGIALPWTASSASWVTSTERAHTIADTSSSLGAVTTTRSRLRKLLITFCSSAVATTTSGAS